MSHHPRTGVTDHIESLGLRTYTKERKDAKAIRSRPVFKHEPVLILYRVELPALFGHLIRDERDEKNTFSRTDPNLFDKELDELLVIYGPLIWPQPGEGSRDHLREPQEGTNYPSDLIYPKDTAVLKHHLRGMVLSRRVRSQRELIDVDSLINKTHKQARFLRHDFTNGLTGTIPVRRRRSTATTADEPAAQRTCTEKDQSDESDESEDSVIGTETHCQARETSAHSPDPPFKVDLRIYHATSPGQSVGSCPVGSYGSLPFTDKDMSCEEFFASICNRTKTDCDFLIFQLPEDMSMEERIRIDRGCKNSEVGFRRILGILQKARSFPGGPLHRSVELEIGFATVVD